MPIFTQPNLIDMKWHGCMKKLHYHIYLLESLIEKGLRSLQTGLATGIIRDFSEPGYPAVP